MEKQEPSSSNPDGIETANNDVTGNSGNASTDLPGNKPGYFKCVSSKAVKSFLEGRGYRMSAEAFQTLQGFSDDIFSHLLLETLQDRPLAMEKDVMRGAVSRILKNHNINMETMDQALSEIDKICGDLCAKKESTDWLDSQPIDENSYTQGGYPSNGNQTKLIVTNKRMAFIVTQKIQELNLNAPLTIQASSVFYVSALLEYVVNAILDESVNLVIAKGKKGIRTSDLVKALESIQVIKVLQDKPKVDLRATTVESQNSQANNNRNTMVNDDYDQQYLQNGQGKSAQSPIEKGSNSNPASSPSATMPLKKAVEEALKNSQEFHNHQPEPQQQSNSSAAHGNKNIFSTSTALSPGSPIDKKPVTVTKVSSSNALNNKSGEDSDEDDELFRVGNKKKTTNVESLQDFLRNYDPEDFGMQGNAGKQNEKDKETKSKTSLSSSLYNLFKKDKDSSLKAASPAPATASSGSEKKSTNAQQGSNASSAQSNSKPKVAGGVLIEDYMKKTIPTAQTNTPSIVTTSLPSANSESPAVPLSLVTPVTPVVNNTFTGPTAFPAASVGNVQINADLIREITALKEENRILKDSLDKSRQTLETVLNEKNAIASKSAQERQTFENVSSKAYKKLKELTRDKDLLEIALKAMAEQLNALKRVNNNNASGTSNTAAATEDGVSALANFLVGEENNAAKNGSNQSNGNSSVGLLQAFMSE